MIWGSGKDVREAKYSEVGHMRRRCQSTSKFSWIDVTIGRRGSCFAVGRHRRFNFELLEGC